MNILTISSPPESIGTIFERSGCGAYEIFVKNTSCLPGIDVGRDKRVYIGKSNKFMRRKHLKTGKSGWSTLRRSLGAILKAKLGLKAEPRSTDGNCYNYQFDDAGEEQLTEWMLANLEVTIHEFQDADCEEESVKCQVKVYEKDLIQKHRPPLNLEKGFPQANKIKALRRACADEARGNQ